MLRFNRVWSGLRSGLGSSLGWQFGSGWRLTALSLFLVFSLFFSLCLGPIAPALAIIRQFEEAPGQVLIQSRQTLRDRLGQSWQVVLFVRPAVSDRVGADRAGADRSVSQPREVALRLVGFPGQVAFRHPATLALIASQDQQWQAADGFATGAPGDNVGQYDLHDLLPTLPIDQPLDLQLPLVGETRSLRIPVAVLLEWRDLARR